LGAVDKRRARTPVFELIFIVCGIWLIGLGLYFAILRPALLPEDLRYIGASVQDIQATTPGIVGWLHRVFTVMGGFIMGAGVLLIAVAMNASQMRKSVTMTVLALAGVFTVGLMSLTNFQLNSDFKWLLLIPLLLWLAGLISYQRHS
jgi:hypothetical protein